QIETMQVTPPRVDIDLRAAAEECLERFGQAGEGLVQFVDGVERQRRTAPKMIGHVPGAYPGRKSTEVRVRGRLEVAALTRQPEPIRFPPMMLENLVEGRPREQPGEPVRGTAAEQMLLEPVSREKFVHRHRCEECRKPRRPGITLRIQFVKCLFGWPPPSCLANGPAWLLVISARSPYTCKWGLW